MKLYQRIASAVDARLRCEKNGNTEWFDRHTLRLERIARNILPSGSGFDCGTAIDLDESKPERLVLHTEYHHMTDGYYDGWTEHSIIVTPSLQFGFNLRVAGKNRNDIKDYICQVFEQLLNEEYDDATEV